RRLPLVGQGLEVELEVGQRLRVEQLAQLLLAEQLAQQVAIEGEGSCPPLRQRRVAVVHVRGDVVEQERAGKWARLSHLDRVDRDLASGDPAEDVAERGQVEDVG